ncbi:patatin-like phospholipase family protein [Hymenobacter sediminicola]|uniref:Patatin-like phospholipase family protein n=1 Tax=Hymenobacter sediminicola TaxID=2761579 RepID=A0A7G7WC71_9BACT|nr:patatin-like phospholipase family protein [Hymenobacter sediminicola]QNH63964.1 patatin-like phospholipase family protein [Hymenobacter sediminicola]
MISPQPLAGSSNDSVFDRIALSLSGGGFRASAYSLGTLKALYQLGLLEQVHMLSTASGGTITGAYYAMRRKSGHTFPDIYHDFYKILNQDAILPQALARWEAGMRAGGPQYKLIQAFAETYSQQLYGEARLGMFWEPDASAQAPFHLQSLIFGATEMYSGLAFRFQHSAYLPAPKGKTRETYAIDNGNVSLPAEHARKLRLGDVVAASSCFPGGFEPLVLPDDFFPGNPPAQLLTKGGRRTSDRVALLDGGIYDNQGIDSLLVANERNRRHLEQVQLSHSARQAALLQPTTLFLVADVGGADKNIYQPPPPLPHAAWAPKLWHILLLLVVLVAGLGLGAWQLHEAGTSPFFSGVLAGLGTVGALGLLVAGWGIGKLRRMLHSQSPNLPDWVLPRLARLSVPQLRQLLALRLGSTLKLLTSVFMRRVRSQNYEQLYRQPGGNKPAYQIVSSIIGAIANDFELQTDRISKKQKKEVPKKPRVRQQLAAVFPTIDSARKMGTTLWWQQEKWRLPAIVASAEITLCYQLLRRFEKHPPRPDSREAEVQRRAQLLWDAYQRGGPNYLVPLAAMPALQDASGTVEQILATSDR